MRPGHVLLLALATVAAACAPLAAAQLPSTATCTIDVPPVTAPPAVAPGGSATVELSVTNTGRLAVDAVAAVSVPTAGWEIVGENSQNETIPVSGTASFSFTIRAGEQAEGAATVNLVASGTCSTPLGASCPNNGCATGDQVQTTSVQLREPEGLRIPGLDRLSFPIEYLLASVVLVGLAASVPLLLRGKRRGGLVTTCNEPLKMVRPGRGTSFPIEVRNPSQEAVTASLEVASVPEGWTAFMPLPEVQLAAGETRSLWLMVRSPQDAQAGATADVELRVRDPRKPDEVRAVRVRAEVDPGAPDGNTVLPG